jgi:nucleotide-binding universal stress UspA family protein
VDFTEASLAAARWAALRFAPRGHVVLAHVIETPERPPFLRGELPSPLDLVGEDATRLHGGLRGLAALIGEHRASTRVLIGRPEAALATLATEVGAELICVGRSARRRGSARFGATLGARLAAAATHPVLVTNGRRAGALARIVAALDHRPTCGHVLETACEIASGTGRRVDALYVLDPALSAFASAAGAHRDASLGRQIGGADRWLGLRAITWLASLVEAAGGDACHAAPVVAQGDAGSEIVRHARRTDADLIVLGGGGDGAYRRRDAPPSAFGSTARLVTWAAPCSVLIVPTVMAAASRASRAPRAATAVIPAAVLDRMHARRLSRRPSHPPDGAA